MADPSRSSTLEAAWTVEVGDLPKANNSGFIGSEPRAAPMTFAGGYATMEDGKIVE